MRSRHPAIRPIARVAAVVGTVAVLGELGHHVLDHMGAHTAHHLFHVGFPALAVLILGLFVAARVRRDGWPSFSWQLEAPSESGTTRRNTVGDSMSVVAPAAGRTQGAFEFRR